MVGSCRGRIFVSTKKQNMKIATFINKFTKETTSIVGVKDLAQAWRLGSTVCLMMNWNEMDFRVKSVK